MPSTIASQIREKASQWLQTLQDQLDEAARSFPSRPMLGDQSFDAPRDFSHDSFEIALRHTVPTPSRVRPNFSFFDGIHKVRFSARQGGARFSNDLWGIQSDIQLKNLLETQNANTVEMLLPKRLFTEEELGELVDRVQDFNRFDDNPTPKIHWILAENNTPSSLDEKHHNGYYYLEMREGKNHGIAYLNHSLFDSKNAFGVAKSVLIHELAHGLDLTHALSLQPEWQVLHLASLHFHNFYLFMDWQYYPDRINGGHPQGHPRELVASAVHAYYLHGDLLVKRIQNAPSQETRDFGIAVWCHASSQGKPSPKGATIPFPTFRWNATCWAPRCKKSVYSSRASQYPVS